MANKEQEKVVTYENFSFVGVKSEQKEFPKTTTNSRESEGKEEKDSE